MIKKLSLGIIGHVDHGKTSLVKALTGIDTDRLKEEKERGLSIELGFSYLHTKNQGIIDLIDVPGHESFIRTMVSGATGIDGIILTIAANEGIQKQTYEHFEIAKLLGIKKGIIVVTKSDLITPDLQNDLLEKIKVFVENSFLQSAPIVSVSAIKNKGIDNLKNELEELFIKHKAKGISDYFYLPIDRVFTIKGFGTVVTGTLRNSVISLGDEVEIMPSGLHAQIRRIEAHNEEVDIAYPGQRVAVNLRNIDKYQISRGCSLVSTNYLKTTRVINAEFTILDKVERIPKRNEQIKLLFGTSEILANYKILDQTKLKEGHTSIVQFKSKCDIATPNNNLFIVRTCSPPTTIGGGKITDNNPGNTSYNNIDLGYIADASLGKTNSLIYEKIKYSENSGIRLDELAKSTAVPSYKIKRIVNNLPVIIIDDVLLILKNNIESLCEKIQTSIKEFHSNYPEDRGISSEKLKLLLPKDISPKVYKYLLQLCLEKKIIRYESYLISSFEFNPINELNLKQRKLYNEIESIFKNGRFKTAELKDVVGVSENKKKLYMLLKGAGILVEIKNKDIGRPIVFHKDTIQETIEILNNTYANSKSFTISDFRKSLNTSRKYAVPLLEYLDAKKITRREGDCRTLFNS